MLREVHQYRLVPGKWTPVILALVLFGAFAQAANAANMYLDTVVGFQGKFKPGHWTPLHITVENKGTAIQGTLQIEVSGITGRLEMHGLPSLPERFEHELRITDMIEFPISGDMVLDGSYVRVSMKNETASSIKDGLFIYRGVPYFVGDFNPGDTIPTKSGLGISASRPRHTFYRLGRRIPSPGTTGPVIPLRCEAESHYRNHAYRGNI